MKLVSLTMVRNDLNHIPNITIPSNYRIVTFKRGEEAVWAEIEASVDEFADKAAARNHFDKEFGSHLQDMEDRCLFIVNERGESVGTTTAWYGSLRGEDTWGRIHWVAVKPEYQGKKLAKPLLSSALQILSRFHDKAYLTTQTTSYRAINLYLNYGFEPLITKPECLEGWRIVERQLDRNILG
ncbi:Mycothiol acetyltransferase [Paenibacillus konkukensis]|uniref:Mycothiol acetyltransferase n=1 Tax=Paenibacillus konkukensis TaxID=2020716 RepID=A0ABY4RH50_9BACL|nr:GNAT family N-acetyltransferase [Paenibacillus konkukensis]UQZ81191.1 Mycothiol acetyltransferase [Paenibacillus konkukensis]